jgi:hypothetical protein
MVLIIGGICSGAIAAYALWKRAHHGNVYAELATANRIKISSDILISFASALSWLAGLFSGKLFGSMSSPDRSAGTTNRAAWSDRRPTASDFGERAADLSEEEKAAAIPPD